MHSNTKKFLCFICGLAKLSLKITWYPFHNSTFQSFSSKILKFKGTSLVSFLTSKSLTIIDFGIFMNTAAFIQILITQLIIHV